MEKYLGEGIVKRSAHRGLWWVKGMCLGICCLACRDLYAQQSEQSERLKQTREIKKLDRFSGQTVSNVDEALQVILERAANAPRMGELAPDFRLIDSDSGEMVHLSEFCREGPVVVFFGSGTCGVTCGRAMDMKGLAEHFASKVKFLMVYIREAHPRDGFAVETFSVIDDPRTMKRRIHAAKSWRKQFKAPFPVLVDDMQDTTAASWAAWPVRLFVVDRDRKVIYAGAPGPWYCKPTKNYVHKVKPPAEVSAKGFQSESLEEFLETFQKLEK